MTFAMNGDAMEFSRPKQSNEPKVLIAFRGIAPFLYPAFGSSLGNRPLFLFAKAARPESLTDLRARLRILAFFFFFVLLFSALIPTTAFANAESTTSVPSLPARPTATGTVKLQSAQNNFGSTQVGAAAPIQTLTWQFSSTTTLSAVDILTIGASGLDYSDGGSSTCVAGTQYAAGSSCTVNVAFTPTVPGMRSGAVTLYAQSSNLPLVTWYLNGVGQSGSVTIDPGTQSTIGSISGGAPYGSAVDGAGNVYVVDNAGGQVIELAANTFTQSMVLTGLSGPTAAAIDGAGNLYVSDTQNNRVVMVPNENGTLNGTDMSVLSISGLGSPYGIALDGSGNLYVADVTNGEVLEVPAGGGTPTIVAPGLTSPLGIAVDFAGNVYVAANNSVTEYPSGGGAPVPLGGGYNNPSGLTVDAAGNVYVADTGNGRIVEVSAGGASQSSFAVIGLTAPQNVSLDAADNLYITDSGNVYEVNRTQAAALVFSPTSIGSASAVQTLTVSDNGNQALTATSLAVAANFLQEPSGGTDCSSSANLYSGGQCLIAIAFTPMQGGALTGTLTLTDNALNNPASGQLVQLSGSGLQLMQTITFSTNAPASAAYNSNFTVAATANSNLPVVYSSAGACTNSGATYTMTGGSGTCSVVADQPGNGNYTAALQVTQTISATPATQTITFSASAPANATYNTNFVVAATATSNLPVVYSNAGTCTNSGATYTMTSGTGTCSVVANQSGNSNYSPAVPVTLSTSATPVTQTITFISNAPTNAAYNSTFSVLTTASSNLPVVYTSAGACSNSGTTYTVTNGSGTCTVIANQPGNNNYSPAPQVTQTVNTAAVTQAITFITNAPTNAAYNSTFTVLTIASSNLPIVYTSAGACANSGATYTITAGSGTCAVIANQPGNSNYSPALQVTQSTSAMSATQTIAFAVKAPTSSGYNSNFTVSANASSGLAVVYSSSGVCSNSGAAYTITATGGTCTVIANQPGNTNFTAAPTITESIIASKGTPTTIFSGAPAAAPYQSTFAVAATTNASTKAVITASGSCSISGGTTVTMTSGSGTCTVAANWAADSQYLAASASQTTSAQKLAPNLTWATPAAITYGTALTSAQLNAKATYGSTTLTGAFVYTPANNNVPTAGNNTLSVVFTPTNSTNYTGATGSVTLLVNKASTTTKITSASPSAPTVGQSVQVNLSVATGYGKPTQSVTVNSSTGESCSATLSSGLGNCSLIFSTTGSRTLTATYSGDNNDLTSASVGFTLSIVAAVKIPPTVTFTGAPATAPYQSTFTVAATTNASTKAVITANGSCSISGTTVTMTSGSGTCTVAANWAADSQYLAATGSQTTSAQKLVSNLTWATPAAITYGTALNSAELNATASSGSTALTGSFVYTPPSGNVPAAGTHTLSVVLTPSNTANYMNATGSVTLLVNQISTATKITTTSPSSPLVGQSVQVNFGVTAGYGKPTQSVMISSSTGERCSGTLSGGTGSCNLNFSTTGSRTLTATYSGDNNDLTSTSAGLTLSVGTASKDFSFSTSPPTITVSPGSTWTTSPSTSLSVASLNGFLGTISVTVSGLPAGVTCSPSSPFNVTARPNYPFDTFLTFTASSVAAVGTYTVTLQGISGSLTHSTSVTLNVASPLDFGLSISPAGVSVSPGSASSPLVVSTASLGGFSGLVSISVGGLPVDATTSPSGPFSVSGGGNQEMTINVPGSAATGSYPVVFTGTSGNLIHTANLALTVSAIPFSQKIQHVVVIFQENRTPDNLFHGLPHTYPNNYPNGPDIADSGINSAGEIIPLTSVPLNEPFDLDHSHASFLKMYDGGKMDGADQIQVNCGGASDCPPPNPQFMYVDPDDVQPYLQLAEQYTFGDRMFQTNQGPSFPAHQFIIAGTSAPTESSPLFAAENPTDGYGCDAQSNSYVQLIDPLGNLSQTMYPCFEHSTLMDLLDSQMITWRYYTPSVSSLWTGPNAIQHIYFGPDWSNVVTPETTVLKDIANNKLPQVSWVIPSGYNSDHPAGDGGGPSWIAAVVNAIGNSQYWGNTAIIITWDDWGGWYDHVAPPIYNSYEYGFRVPLIIVSPYAKQGYVSHVTHDFGSILKFTEEVFNLPSLGYADSRADDFSDCFDLSQTPVDFQVVPAALPADFFLNDKRPPTPPDVD